MPNELMDYMLTNEPSRWASDPVMMAQYEQIFGKAAADKLRTQGVVQSSTFGQSVGGTNYAAPKQTAAQLTQAQLDANKMNLDPAFLASPQGQQWKAQVMADTSQGANKFLQWVLSGKPAESYYTEGPGAQYVQQQAVQNPTTGLWQASGTTTPAGGNVSMLGYNNPAGTPPPPPADPGMRSRDVGDQKSLDIAQGMDYRPDVTSADALGARGTGVADPATGATAVSRGTTPAPGTGPFPTPVRQPTSPAPPPPTKPVVTSPRDGNRPLLPPGTTTTDKALTLEELLAGLNSDDPNTKAKSYGQMAKGVMNNPGALTIATLLGSKAPKSWNTPGVGYGNRTNYFNAAGKPFRSGEDTESYWYNPNDRAWFSGNLEGQVKETKDLPWQSVPWVKDGFQSPGDQRTQYFNAEGKTFGPGDQESFWYSKPDQKWYQGDLKQNIKPAYELPWMK